ncbi:MAG: hypothetical protein QNL12_15580 [Acidimicrobiia bacterium]|nr:hypothetical protein [Acidimicrobiia bacterium]MDX2468734.1 hypothetical protein [Acidimicrobiia bacterium]
MTTGESFASVVQQRSKLGEAMQLVEEAAAAPAAKDGWSADLVVNLEQLELAFNEHIVDVQSPDGLLDRIVDQAPRLQRAVEVKKREHTRIAGAIGETIERSSTAQTPDVVVDLRETVMELLIDLSRHRQKGADLIYDAYAIDIGGY